MFQILDVYDYIYDADLLKKIDIQDILNMGLSREIIHVLLTDIKISRFR